MGYIDWYSKMSVFLIAFRDFIEAFLILGILLGFSKKQNLNKENIILAGGITGLCAALLVAFLAFYILPFIKIPFPVETIDTIGHFSVIFSGFMILYITYYLHPFFVTQKNKHVEKLFSNKEATNIIFFIFTFLLVMQEGFEIVVFGTSTSFFESSLSNILSLFAGFLTAVLIGMIFYKTYLKNHIKKLFRITEFIFIVYGLFLIAHGLMEFFE